MDSQSANLHKIQSHIDSMEKSKKYRTFFIVLLFLPFSLGLLLSARSLVSELSSVGPTSPRQQALPSTPAEYDQWESDNSPAISDGIVIEQIDTISVIGYRQENPELRSVLASYPGQTYLDARGPRTVGVPLMFSIANYRPDVAYTIDFGNGVSQTVSDGQLDYAYPEEGDYTARIVGIYQGREIITKKLSLSIRSASHMQAL